MHAGAGSSVQAPAGSMTRLAHAQPCRQRFTPAGQPCHPAASDRHRRPLPARPRVSRQCAPAARQTSACRWRAPSSGYSRRRPRPRARPSPPAAPAMRCSAPSPEPALPRTPRRPCRPRRSQLAMQRSVQTTAPGQPQQTSPPRPLWRLPSAPAHRLGPAPLLQHGRLCGPSRLCQRAPPLPAHRQTDVRV